MQAPSVNRYITVALDGSSESQAAARFAVHEAKIRTADIRVAQAFPAPSDSAQLTAGGVTYVVETGSDLVHDIHTETVAAPVAHVLLKRLEGLSELIVLGHPGLTHEIPTAAGGVLDLLTARANCPTALIPRGWHEPTVARSVVVVAVDGDAGSIEALRWAFDEAVMRGGELEVVQAISPVASDTEMSSQQRNLAEMLADWRSDHPGLAVRIDVTRGDPTQLLIQASADGAVLVIGHPDTEGLASSSRAARLLAVSDCPLVLVPAAGHPNDRPHERVPVAA
jgi:nucleotide-binding universal stress UspA family protein